MKALQEAKKQVVEESVAVPTPEDETRATAAASHEAMLSMLHLHIVEEWPSSNNEGDLVPADWKSRLDLGPNVTPSNEAPSKRPRPPTHSVIGVSPEDEPVVAVEKVVEKKRRARAPRVQRQGVRRSARIANKA